MSMQYYMHDFADIADTMQLNRSNADSSVDEFILNSCLYEQIIRKKIFT